MVWVRGVLASHQVMLALLHGQAFFVLGLSVLLLTRRGIRLELAGELAPLAAFGLCEAAVAWATAWLGAAETSPVWLAWCRLVLLALGSALLLSFALQVHMPADGRDRQRWLAAGGLLLAWGLGVAVAGFSGIPEGRTRLVGEIAARCGFALPGGLLGAWALRRDMYRTIEPARLALVKGPVRIGALGLGSFALFGGLIGPAAPFFPANLINEDLLLSSTGVPVALLRALSGVALGVSVVQTLSAVLNEVELWLESVERMHALVDERERIGRDLHDGIIQSIYASGLILEGARQNIAENPRQARDQLTHAIENLNRTIWDIRRYIFDLRGELPQDDLQTGVREILKDFRINTLLEIEFRVNGDGIRRIDAERRQHVFQIVREALTNVARHAHAGSVRVHLNYGANALQLSISDDGVGLSAPPSSDGQGLRNIRERARLLNAVLDVDTAPQQGLRLILSVPYEQRIALPVRGDAGCDDGAEQASPASAGHSL
ncbi:MAG: sensor histidine kinase [Chloroflexota bacterium]|nr:sensor histidine kinase [Chloroflexota bacterium]